jgi:phosphoribosylglycinamide formyltransferase-1
VLDAGETVSGVSIHVVDEEYDHGPIVAQRQVNVLADDSAEDLAARVLEQEHGLYAETLQQIAAGEIDLSKLVNDWKS